MAFTAKILSWRFRHLNIVGFLLERRPTKGGSRAPQDPSPLATPWLLLCIRSITSRCSGKWPDRETAEIEPMLSKT